ncbi:protein CLEC16A-like isoform X3 [Dreissena polymorpha]|uniref:protein CLEC16A-like isoform X3 n=1 Tax=Dreissena polymorpha TaxID=45954 RepID=UPI002263EA20|nr:protein CLEC16A-like isoform X3 [Dreissena polymorpha]
MLGKSKGWLSGFGSKPKNPHSLEQLKYLYNVLCKNQTVTEQNRVLLVETLRSISEILIWGDQNDSSVFDFFLEKNMLTFFLRYMRQKYGRFICVQLLQTLNILFDNISNETSLYYLLSNNHINCIIVHKFDFSDEEVMAYYISFLKTLSLKLNKHTIHFFYNEHTNDFALYTEAIKFFNHSEGMVRIAVRTITLNVYKVQDVAMLRYIRDRTAAPYFSNLVWFVGNHILNLDICVRNDIDHQNRGRLETLVAEHLDHLHYVNDILMINIDTLNDVLSDQLLNRLLIPLYVYSLTKRKRHDLRQRGRKFVSSVVSLFLLSQVFLIIRHAPLVRQLAEIIFHGETETGPEDHTSESPRMLVREFIAPNETLEETLDSSRGLRPRGHSVRVHEGNSTFYARSSVPGEIATGAWPVTPLAHELPAGRQDSEVFEDQTLPSQNSTDEEKILSTRNQSLRIGGGATASQGAFSLDNRPYLEAIFHALECTENDYEALFALCLLYAMGHNEGIHQGLMDSVFMPTDRSELKDNYNIALVERLIRILTLVTQSSSKVRLATLELSIRLLKQLVYTPGKSYLQDRHLACIENAKECSAQLLRNFYKSDDIFLDMFEDEYNEMVTRPLNVEYLTMDASILLPPTGTPLTGIDFNKRLPCGEVERARRAIRVFFQVRQLSLSLLQEEETQLPLTKDRDCVKIDNILDLNNSDLIACTVVTQDKKQKRFLVIDALQMILVEPDVRRLGWGIVTFVGFLQNIEVTGDKEDSRSLHITVHKPASSHLSHPVPLLAARFIFDDHIRCMAARQRLTKGRMKARQQKMQMIERLLDMPAEAVSHGTFTRSTPIPGRCHPVRVTASATEQRVVPVPGNPPPSQSAVSIAGPEVNLRQHDLSNDDDQSAVAQRRNTIYVENGTEILVLESAGETDDCEDVSEDVEVALEATSEMAFQTLHNASKDVAYRRDSTTQESSFPPQEIPLEDLSKKSLMKKKEQLTRARLTKSRLTAELKKQQDPPRSSSNSPSRSDSDGMRSKRGRSTSLTVDNKVSPNRSRSGTPEKRCHSDSSPLPYSNSSGASRTRSKHSLYKETETQTAFTIAVKEKTQKDASTSSQNLSVTGNTAPKSLQPAPSPVVSLVQGTEQTIDSPKILPPVDCDRIRSSSDLSNASTCSEASVISLSSDLSDRPILGLNVPIGAGTAMSTATVTIETVAMPAVVKERSSSDRLTELAQMVQQYKFEGHNDDNNAIDD